MNPRVLELIKNPKNIQSEDLGLLKEEIHAFPYIQNIRALHLYGVHLYEKENYQKELSITAAYTTDKKILYQLINGKIQQEVTEEKPSVIVAEKPVKYNYNVKGFPIKREETESSVKTVAEKETCILPTNQEVQHIYVNGERNRILFEGEENFLDEENAETIDLESTLESGTLVTQKSEPEVKETIQQEVEEVQQGTEENAGENFTSETVVEENEITSEAIEEKVEEDNSLSFEETESLLTEAEVKENIAEVSEEDAEAVADEEIPVYETEKEEPDTELSFHGTDAFLPDVKIQATNDSIAETVEVPLPNVNKHEEEMRRLIEEVEKKMKETKSAPQEEETEPKAAEDHEISFAETQNFHFWSTGEESPEQAEVKEEEPHEEAIEQPEPERDVAEESVPEVQTAWKPMSLESHIPDSLINKPVVAVVPATAIPVATEAPVVEPEAKNIESVEETEEIIEPSAEDILPAVEEAQELSEEKSEDSSEEVQDVPETVSQEKKEEVPVMNVSFFGTDISSLKVGEGQKEKKEEPAKGESMKDTVAENTAQSSINSNVPGFINTWQSWLKIDRVDEVVKEKEEIKEKAIENFIENNPRISQLKEESSYVVKEKNDDISHLMTETLANLYVEQKLYSKAIKAFGILIKKYPEKKEYFETKIKEIKDFRSKN
ncbi:hypothetical protein DRF65_05890 [Chryseobacterium pennae]|uniref:Tetratricopeptide repeat protein n=1 Tax=Chryseobacterium pennae TaxID=2258962 RepID=A0A3D9CBD7_9FLAO|nr:hypothetical protein [Chryseobacterium pennae]REC63183.1 hypothetical protein DRF65_05890 [Chryseobacterium pennae]